VATSTGAGDKSPRTPSPARSLGRRGRKVRDTLRSDASSVEAADGKRGDESRWFLAAALILAAAVAVIGVDAAVALARRSTTDRWTPVLQDIVKVSYQGVMIGALAGSAKVVLDRRRAGEQARDAHAALQQTYTRTLINASYRVDSARTLIRANQSVKTWSEQVDTEIIPAELEIRALQHELRTWKAAGRPAFEDTDEIQYHLNLMTDYLRSLIDEYADNKRDLSEKQREAEDQATAPQRRKVLLADIWNGITELDHTGDLVTSRIDEGSPHDRLYIDDDDESGHDKPYGQFRVAYLTALRLMRKSLAGPTKHVWRFVRIPWSS
jgi:hypothetical protein